MFLWKVREECDRAEGYELRGKPRESSLLIPLSVPASAETRDAPFLGVGRAPLIGGTEDLPQGRSEGQRVLLALALTQIPSVASICQGTRFWGGVS